jgi:hypothetical protein
MHASPLNYRPAATSGIGKTTLNQFTKCTSQPRISFANQRATEGHRIKMVLKTLNPNGKYH